MRDLVGGKAPILEHRIGVLADPRRRALDLGGRAEEARRRGGLGDPVDRDKALAMAVVRSVVRRNRDQELRDLENRIRTLTSR